MVAKIDILDYSMTFIFTSKTANIIFAMSLSIFFTTSSVIDYFLVWFADMFYLPNCSFHWIGWRLKTKYQQKVFVVISSQNKKRTDLPLPFSNWNHNKKLWLTFAVLYLFFSNQPPIQWKERLTPYHCALTVSQWKGVHKTSNHNAPYHIWLIKESLFKHKEHLKSRY